MMSKSSRYNLKTEIVYVIFPIKISGGIIRLKMACIGSKEVIKLYAEDKTCRAAMWDEILFKRTSFRNNMYFIPDIDLEACIHKIWPESRFYSHDWGAVQNISPLYQQNYWACYLLESRWQMVFENIKVFSSNICCPHSSIENCRLHTFLRNFLHKSISIVIFNSESQGYTGIDAKKLYYN